MLCSYSYYIVTDICQIFNSKVWFLNENLTNCFNLLLKSSYEAHKLVFDVNQTEALKCLICDNLLLSNVLTQPFLIRTMTTRSNETAAKYLGTFL